MKAVVLKAYGDVDQLIYEEVEKPKPGAGEVLVRIAATSINPIDFKLRSGAMKAQMPLQLPTILGRDLAGEVAELGEGVAGLHIGQRVLALANNTYAEYATVKGELVAAIPDGLSFEQAAALPLVTLTGAQLIERGVKIKQGQSVIITGGLGGVGRTAIFVAMQHHGQVIAAVRSSQMAEAEALGTLALVALEDEEGLSAFQQIDAFADTIGGAVAAKLFKYLRSGAVYASVVGVPEEAKNYDIHAEAVYSQPDAARLSQLAAEVAANRLKIPVAKVMKLSEIREAHHLAEAGGVRGKIVLTP
ncbi:NADP-dependent oxidoreductase [Acidisarcina polymorpha]|nr:NADP-dependent oxidoreductase [Acidisarcina polymorpha]